MQMQTVNKKVCTPAPTTFNKVTCNALPGNGASHSDSINITPRGVRHFCHNILKMRYKRATRSKKHHHDKESLDKMKKLFLLRLTFLVVMFTIPMALVVNIDETGVLLMPLKPQGWAPCGQKVQTVFYGAGDILYIPGMLHTLYFSKI